MMKIHKGITLKLFIILSLFLILFTGIIIYVQLFIVSRMYLSTEYSTQKKLQLYPASVKFADEYTSIIKNNEKGKYKNKNIDINQNITYAMYQYEYYNQAYIIILNENFNIKYSTASEDKIFNIFNIKNIHNTLKRNPSLCDSVSGFRIKGMFNLPSKYTVVSSLHYGKDYIVTITRDVYTSESEQILKRYVIYIFIFAAVMILILSGIFSYIITKPIVTINKTASKMINMNFSEKCDIKSKDEIGSLAGSLNFLSNKLNSTLNELYTANKNLKNELEIEKDFIGAVSHEFKTPITIIRGYTESLKDNVAVGNEKDMAYNIIFKETSNMNKLVQNLIELSIMESKSCKLDMSTFYIDNLLMSIYEKYKYIIKEKDISFSYNVNYKNAAVKADKFRIEQVITNFLSNAAINTPEKGSIILLSKKQEKRIYISVQNSGNHISKENMQKIWDKFYRIDKSRSKKSGGTGLGLAICKAILENHSFSYGVKNTEYGVEFYFYIPYNN